MPESLGREKQQEVRFLWSLEFAEVRDEEGCRAALDGPKKEGTGDSLTRFPVPSSGTTCAPVLELADSRDLHSRGLLDRPGPTPGWGTKFSPARNLCDIKLRCKKKPRRSVLKVNEGQKRNAWLSKAILKTRSQNS
jgi:hypothetical protein